MKVSRMKTIIYRVALACPLLFFSGCATPEDTALLGGVLSLATGSPNLTAAQSVAYQAASATAFETARIQAQQRAAQASQPQVTVNNFTPAAPTPAPAPVPAPPPPKPAFDSLSSFVTPATGTDGAWVVGKFTANLTGAILPVGFAELTGDNGVFSARPTQLHVRADRANQQSIFVSAAPVGLEEFREIKPGEDLWFPLAGHLAKNNPPPLRVELSVKYWKPAKK